MLSVADSEAEDKWKAEETKRKAVEVSAAAKRARLEEADRAKIEQELPGERERIQEGLASLGAQKV